jgi:hypothetical protein
MGDMTEDSREETEAERQYRVLRDAVREVRSDVRSQTGVFPEETPARRFGRLTEEKLSNALAKGSNAADNADGDLPHSDR